MAKTDSDHDGPILADLAKAVAPAGPDQLWVADLMTNETLEDGAADLPRFIENAQNRKQLRSAPGYLSPAWFAERPAWRTVKAAA